MTSRKEELPEEPFDPDADVESDELNFDDEEEQSFTALSPEEDSFEAQLSNANEDMQVSDTNDDLDPEILIKEDGALSPNEAPNDIPADMDLTIVDIKDIGAGHGLDEAEWAQVQPLDKKP
jgi:hypothetical protein